LSWLSKTLGLDYQGPASDPRYDDLLRQLRDPSFGQQSVADSTRAAVQGALPDFLSNLGGLKEQNIRRGISTGDLGTSFENDLTSAFQRNIANSVAGQSANMFNNRTGLLFQGLNDSLDRKQGAINDASQRRSGFLNGLMQTAGTIAAFSGGGGK